MPNSNGYPLEKGVWDAVAIAALIVFLRVFAKIKIKRFFVDDVLMIIALVLTVVSTVLLGLCLKHGFGGVLTKMPQADYMLVLKYLTIQVLLVTLSAAIARSKFIVYLLMILGNNKTYKIALWLVLVILAAGNITSAVLPLVICGDARALWDPRVAMHTTCGDTTAVIKFAYYSSSFNSATDIFLALFPTVIFWNLKLKLSIKISLIILMSVGFIAMIASIIKTTKLDQVPSLVNPAATGAPELIRWGHIENAIIIITSSIPCIRPLIVSSVHKLSSATRSYELSGPFSTHRTVGNETNHFKMARRFNRSDILENSNSERFLDHSVHITTTTGGRPDISERAYPGITKQVEISVTSDDQQRRI